MLWSWPRSSTPADRRPRGDQSRGIAGSILLPTCFWHRGCSSTCSACPSQSTVPNETQQQEQAQLVSKVEEQVKTILSDLSGAVKYVEDGVDVHPNRIDIAQGKGDAPQGVSNASDSSNPFSKPPTNPFGTVGTAPAFGQASNPTFGQTSAQAFGQPTPSAFGQPSNPGQSTSAFGQPSNPGQTSAFGQPTALGGGTAFGKPSAPGTGAFGQPSILGGGSTFGQTPAFGKPSLSSGGSAFGQNPPAFGQPSVPAVTSAFGQPLATGTTSAFGQPSVPGTTSAFGKPSVPGQPSAFGQVSGLGQTNAFAKPAFGQSGFGQTSQSGAAPAPFGQRTEATQSTPFGQQTQSPQPANPFSKPPELQNQAPANSFGATNASQPPGFGTKPSPFVTGTSQVATTQPSNPFATAKQQSSGAAAPSPFGSSAQVASPFGQPQPQQAASSQFSQQAQPIAESGIHPITQAPIDPRDRFKEGKPEDYAGELGNRLEKIYKRVAQIGLFDDGEDIPLVPPKCEWIMPV
jgi:nucleoporin NUP42